MNIIRNLHLLKDIDPERLTSIEQEALGYQRSRNITFKITEFDGKAVVVNAVQGKVADENMITKKQLIQIAKDLFEVLEYKVHVHASEYKVNPVDEVTYEWIKEQMLKNDLKLKHIGDDTGIDKTRLSANINGLRPLSQTTKAMFYYYFLAKKKQK